ncbi:prepilin-type N-terminal cleavage/methylation domain-containing protein [Elusimicrobium simillimum]|uniref:type IV pilin protein n=1 Tax=Elusimicrobium simillimum TaxID=3143438 RepID=UPI003C6F121B
MRNKRGFTLIELMVVVIIIGILAAAAMPYYIKAIEKTRAAEPMTVLKRVRDMQSISEATLEKKMRAFKNFDRTYSAFTLTTSNYGNLEAFPDGQGTMKNYDYVISSNPNEMLYENIVAIKNNGYFRGYGLFFYKGEEYCMEETTLHDRNACDEIFMGEKVATAGNWDIYKSNQ